MERDRRPDWIGLAGLQLQLRAPLPSSTRMVDGAVALGSSSSSSSGAEVTGECSCCTVPAAGVGVPHFLRVGHAVTNAW